MPNHDFPIVVTLVYATSIVAGIVMMMSLDTFSKEMDSKSKLPYYDGYEVLKMKVTKMAKDADIWAITAIVVQSASLVLYLTINKMGTFKEDAHTKLRKLFNAMIVLGMYATHLPVVAMVLLIVCGDVSSGPRLQTARRLRGCSRCCSGRPPLAR
jgi:hypothetical protein